MNKQIIETYNCDYCDYKVNYKARLIYHLKSKHLDIDIKKIQDRLKNFITKDELDSNDKVKQTKFKKYGNSYYNNNNKSKQTNLEKYGVKNVSQIEKIKEKKKQTTLEHYHVENPFQSDKIKEKIKQTHLENYGVEYISQSDEIKEKLRQTHLKKYGKWFVQTNEHHKKSKQTKRIKYGNENYRNENQIKQTNLKKYGVEYGLSSSSIQQKISETCLERYGVNRYTQTNEYYIKSKQAHFKKYGKWFSQTNEHHNKNYQWKDYILPSGKIIQIQGYENKALDILLKTYLENDIIIGNDIQKFTGELWYKNQDNTQHRYFPDIFIVSENTVIEVKSTYTYYKNKLINLLKQKCVEDKGFKFKFMIFRNNNQDDNINKDKVMIIK